MLYQTKKRAFLTKTKQKTPTNSFKVYLNKQYVNNGLWCVGLIQCGVTFSWFCYQRNCSCSFHLPYFFFVLWIFSLYLKNIFFFAILDFQRKIMKSYCLTARNFLWAFGKMLRSMILRKGCETSIWNNFF